jgi:hypothetical protein
MNATIDQSPEAHAMRMAQGMRNDVLAATLENAANRKWYTPVERKAIVAEVARRLRWADAYENGKTV